ncbi:hypothetical protein C452_01725 [Haloferax volcanii JCM 10717]|uniref:Small CPxCG-related zinc finger protein n=2 Tax=Haloferax volcanii TaxID=2246 RepID=M0IFY2_HALVO|nr:hypothetical protein C456_02976 [Haloferax lucentense DSM 14919]ELZ94758.1 hypothetical protein C452_01725 [Haloferax alexandrinus JCM 10717]
MIAVPGQFVFDCPECSVEVCVDAGIRERILDDGCVLCASTVETDAFDPHPRKS